MLFTVLPIGYSPPSTPGQVFLISDRWDDWFEFETQFFLIAFDHKGERHEAGSVKIGRFGLTREERRPNIPQNFDVLDAAYFSLGQGEDFYITLNTLGEDMRNRILIGLRDVANDLVLFEKAKNERVMQVSLMRYVSADHIRGRLNRLAKGDSELTRYAFTYQLPVMAQFYVEPLILEFEVKPGSMPPTNIHVLIGRNGVGKTRCLDGMTRALVAHGANPSNVGIFSSHDIDVDAVTFANVVSVSFSAFDPFDPLEATVDQPLRIPYEYIGLKWKPSELQPRHSETAKNPSNQPGPFFQRSPSLASSQMTADRARAPKSPDDLKNDFVMSVEKCRVGRKSSRWRQALETLEGDPLFEAAGIVDLADDIDEGWKSRAAEIYRNLSSGHKIVLLTITRLVETVEERSLVLLDEPEAHLHPPLLAAFVRSLSDLLTQRNGVAIIATHSPVVLQEAPKTCGWILRRSGHEVRANRPEIETFGENVGILTREVFRLEVTKSGFHKLLEEAIAQENGSYEAVLARFGGQLGEEARAIVQGLIAVKNTITPEFGG